MRSPSRQTLIAWLILLAAAILAALPLLTHGYSCGHDFDFHLRSWMEASTQWKHGILKPVWAFHAAWNAGEPRLLFYPPLSWITGALLTLIVPWSTIAFAFTTLAFLLNGITMHRLLRRWTGESHATLGGCLYIVNPYMLFCAYERTAYAELMAAAWMPLLLAALLRDRITAWRVAVAIALLWITNAPAGVMGCYTVLLIGGMRLATLLAHRNPTAWTYAAKVTAGVLLGFLLDSFYLLPFATERKYISLTAALTPAASPEANFLYKFTTDEFHNGVLLHSSNIAVILVTIAVLCGAATLLLHRRGTIHYKGMNARDTAAIHTHHNVILTLSLPKGKNPDEPANQQAPRALFATDLNTPTNKVGAGGFSPLNSHAKKRGFSPGQLTIILTLFSIAILLLQLPISTVVWHHAPELNFMQFPWRFLAVQGAVTTTLIALCLNRFLTKQKALAIIGLVVVTAAAYGLANKTFRQGCDDEEGLAPQRAAFNAGQGYEQTDEFTPADDDNDALDIHMPRAHLSAQQDGPWKKSETVFPHETDPKTDDWLFTPTPTAANQFLIVRLRNFHGWHVFRDNVEQTDLSPRADGLIAVPLQSAGAHTVEVRYTKPWDQPAGIALTILSLLGLVAVARKERPRIPVQ